MKKLNRKEYIETFILTRGKRSLNAHIIQELWRLKKGEALYIAKEDWKWKANPVNCVAQITANTGGRYRSQTLADKSGWMVIRVA